MKKVSILSISCLMIGFALFALIPKSNAQTSKRPNYTNTKDLVEVAFTNTFTIDSLVDIKNDLVNRGIQINYKKLEFDETNHLLSISCEIVCDNGQSGSFTVGMLNTHNKNVRFGFYRNYSKGAKDVFGVGWIDKK